MNRLLMFIGLTVGGYVGWCAGEYFEFKLMGTFLLGVLGSAIGVVVTWRLANEYLG